MSIQGTDFAIAGGAIADVPAPVHAERSLASRRIVTAFGFWVFLLTDVVMFSAFFATYVVLENMTAGGPRGVDVFNIPVVALETGYLLASSFTCWIAILVALARHYLICYSGIG